MEKVTYSPEQIQQLMMSLQSMTASDEKAAKPLPPAHLRIPGIVDAAQQPLRAIEEEAPLAASAQPKKKPVKAKPDTSEADDKPKKRMIDINRLSPELRTLVERELAEAKKHRKHKESDEKQPRNCGGLRLWHQACRESGFLIKDNPDPEKRKIPKKGTPEHDTITARFHELKEMEKRNEQQCATEANVLEESQPPVPPV